MPQKHSDIPEPVFLSAPKAAAICGVSRNTICCWIRNDQLPSYRTVGGKHLIRPEDLLKFMEQNQMFVPPTFRQLAQEDADALKTPQPSPEVQQEPTILVVEDDPATRRITTRALKSLNLPIQEAENGFEAMHQLTLNPLIALVVLDMVMPGQGGGETFAQLRNQNASLPVIVITGQDLREVEAQFPDERPDLILSKPFQINHLLESASTFLNDLGF